VLKSLYIVIKMASVCVAYILWLIGGGLGLHHLYLRRWKQAFVWWCLPGGYFGAGWFRDMWRIPEYVADYNREAAHVRKLKEEMKKEEIPPWKMARWMGMLVVGNMFGILPAMAIPNKEDIGVDLRLLKPLLNPLGAAIGVWLVGNIGRWEGSIKGPLLGCYLTTPLYYFGINAGSLCTLAGAYCFKRKWRKIDQSRASDGSACKNLTVLVMCGLLYASLWGSYLYFNAEVNHNGDKIKLRDAVGNFIKSPLAQEFGRNVRSHWQHMLEHGFFSTWEKLVDSLDPFGEKNSLKVLGLDPGATQDQIKSRYRELSKQWHPDKVRGDGKEEAQAKFLEIQAAYENLSNIKNRRKHANRKPVKESDSPSDNNKSDTIEL